MANVTPGEFLRALYGPDKVVAVFRDDSEKKPLLWPTSGGESLSSYKFAPKGAKFLIQPGDGQWHGTGDARSCRSEAACASFPFMLLESDAADTSAWLSVLGQFHGQIASICESGKRSIHAMVFIGAKSKKEWLARVDPMRDALVTLGADPTAMKAVQLSGLPGCVRGDTGREQRLLYLDPQYADGPVLPICKRPVIHHKKEPTP